MGRVITQCWTIYAIKAVLMYCQIHEEDEPRNSQLPCTQGAICLGPSENIQGGFKFMTLTTAKKVVRDRKSTRLNSSH